MATCFRCCRSPGPRNGPGTTWSSHRGSREPPRPAAGFAAWDIAPSRAESDAAFRAAVPDLSAIEPDRRAPAVIAGMFGAGALRRATQLVPRVLDWRPDLVIHPITELAAAVAAELGGARRLVHGFGPLPAEAWSWFGARFGELCEAWDVPHLAESIVASPFVELCPPSLQRDAVSAFTRRVPMRPTSGDVVPGEQLPWDDATLDALPYEHTVHLTLGTLFNEQVHVFEAALTGLRELPVNVIVTVGPGRDPAVVGPQPSHVLVTDFATHSLVLPRCSALITQGGPATILAALCHGLPHLILPQGADQFMNAPVAERAGVALHLVPDAATPANIASSTQRLLGDVRFAAAAGRAQTEISAMPSADDVLAAILDTDGEPVADSDPG